MNWAAVGLAILCATTAALAQSLPAAERKYFLGEVAEERPAALDYLLAFFRAYVSDVAAAVNHHFVKCEKNHHSPAKIRKHFVPLSNQSTIE